MIRKRAPITSDLIRGCSWTGSGIGDYIVYLSLVLFLLIHPAALSSIEDKNYFEKANEYYYVGKYAQALIYYEKDIKENPDGSKAHPLYIECCSRKRNLNKAISFYEEIGKNYPKSAKVLTFLGICYQWNKESKKAEETFEKALRLDQRCPRIYSERGWSYFRDDKKMAEEEFKKGLKVAPEDANLLESLGWLYINTGREEEAKEVFKKAEESASDDWRSLIWIAWGYNYLGEPSGAERIFKKALKVSSPNNCHVLLGLASMYQENLEFEQAMAQIGKVKEIAPNFGRVDEVRKEIIAAKKAVLEFVEGCRQVLAQNPDHKNANFYLGYAMGKMGDFDSAIEQFKKVLKLNPENSMAHNNLGYGYFQKGLIKEAEEEFRKAIELNPDNEIAKNNLEAIEAKEECL